MQKIAIWIVGGIEILALSISNYTALAKISSETSTQKEVTQTTQSQPLLEGIPLSCHLSSSKFIKDGYDKIFLFTYVAYEYARVKQNDKAEEVLSEALLTIKTLENNESKFYSIFQIVDEYYRLGLKRKAKEIIVQTFQSIKDIKNSEIKARVLVEFVNFTTAAQTNSLVQRSLVNEALQLALESALAVKDIQTQFSLLTQIAETHSALGQKEQSLTLLDLASQKLSFLDDATTKVSNISLLAYDYLNLKEKEKALLILSQGLKFAKTVNDANRKTSLETVARGYVAAHQYDIAIKISPQSTAIDVIYEYVNEKKYEKAIETTKYLKDESDRVRGLIIIAEGYSYVGQKIKAAEILSQSTAVAKSIEKDLDKAYGLITIASAYRNQGQLNEFNKLLSLIIEVARNSRDADDKNYILSILANLYVSEKQYDRAIKLVEDSSDPEFKLHVLEEIASMHLSLGEKRKAHEFLSLALESAKDIKDRSSKISTLIFISEMLIETGEKNEVLAVLSPIVRLVNSNKKNSTRNYELETTSKIYARAGLFKQALEVAESLDIEDSNRSSMISLYSCAVSHQ